MELARKTNTDSHKIQVRRREFGNDISRPGILYGIKHTHDFLHAVSVYSFIFSSSDSVTFSHYFATVVVKMLYFDPLLGHLVPNFAEKISMSSHGPFVLFVLFGKTHVFLVGKIQVQIDLQHRINYVCAVLHIVSTFNIN